MEEKSIQNQFIMLLLEKFPKKSHLVSFISETLCIEKDSVYRRLRNEVQFSLEETGIIAKKLSLSLDKAVGISSQKSQPFYYNKLSCYPGQESHNSDFLEEYNIIFQDLNNDPTSEIGMTAKMLPEAFFLEFEFIHKFYILKRLYHYEARKDINMDEIKYSKKMNELFMKIKDLYHGISESYFIFHQNIFLDLVENIKYFQSLDLLNEENKNKIKADLFLLLEKLEATVSNGFSDKGKKMHFYISDMNFDLPTLYIKSKKHSFSTIRAYTTNDTMLNNLVAVDDIHNYFLSIKRTSTQISQCSEIVRRKFFNKQKEYIESL